LASVTDSVRSFTYDQVNNAVCEVLFDGRYRHQPLYLDLEGAVLEDVARALGIPVDACTDAIAAATAAYLSWKTADPFGRFTDDLLAWDDLGRTEPLPCIGLLCTLATAAERMRSDDVYSAHNYYERLFEVLGISDEAQKTKIRLHAKSTKAFWIALNQWLAEHDFEFGRPTAKQVNEWPYVSYALSQALVRDADRQRFHRLFEEVGFRPGEQVSDQEMLLYLHEWLRGHSASQWLKKLWTEPDLRGRVAQAARAELEHWDGASNRTDGVVAKRRTLNWAASLIQFPTRRLQLYLSAAPQDTDEPTPLRLAANPSPAATEAFRGCTEGLWLGNVPGDEFSVLEPVQSIAIRPLMLSSFGLAARDGELTRVARAIVPLLKLESAPYYREVSRVSLLLPHLILCHEQWHSKVQAYLGANARPGFKALRPSELPGLPVDWVLFTNVEVLRRPEYVAQDLEVLAPLAEGVALNPDGGLRLAQGLWHSEQPPEIVAAASEGKVSIQLRQLSLTGAASVLAESGPHALAITLSLQDYELPPFGDFTVVALQDGKIRSEQSLSLRSADCPRRLNTTLSDLHLILRPDLGSALLAGSSGPIPDGLPALSFRGLSTEALGATDLDVSTALPTQRLAEGGTDEEVEVRSYADRDPGNLGESCVLRSHHHYVIEAYTKGDDPNRPRWGKCKDCGDAVFFKHQRPRWRSSRAPAAKRVPQQPVEQIAERPEETADTDLLFDAVCYLGSGKWDRLVSLAGEGADDPWFPGRFAENLRLLGHIDVLLDERGRRPKTFVCAPPVLAIAEDGNAFLAGFRCASLVREVADRLRPIGEVQNVDQHAAPPALIWKGINYAAALSAIADVLDPFGRAIEIVASPGTAFAMHGPSMTSTIESLPSIHIESAPGLERFETGRGNWRRAGSLDSPGAYRTDFAGKRYFYRFANGELKESTHEIVKLIAAREANVRLHSYDARTETFEAVLGSAVPGLLGRALVACSGLVPVRHGARLIYRNIPKEVGGSVLHKLYS
jgi:hypothetical protein